MQILYTAQATATGDGRNGHVRSSDGLIDTDVARPRSWAAPGGATNPEQLFAAGYAACFHNALRRVARAGIGRRGRCRGDRPRSASDRRRGRVRARGRAAGRAAQCGAGPGRGTGRGRAPRSAPTPTRPAATSTSRSRSLST